MLKETGRVVHIGNEFRFLLESFYYRTFPPLTQWVSTFSADYTTVVKKISMDRNSKWLFLSRCLKLFFFVKNMNTTKANTLKPSYLISEIIANVVDLRLMIRSLSNMLCQASVNEVLGKMLHLLWVKFPFHKTLLQEDRVKCLILLRRRSSAKFKVFYPGCWAILVYVRFTHEDDISEEILFIKSLPETTCGENSMK